MTQKERPQTRTVQHTERCKGCGFCIRECPQKALSFSEEVNKKGYAVVAIDTTLCVACGTCYTVCPDYVFEQRAEA
ncbi:MAG: 4Fe-4S binding protein [Desulfovibrionaceae bacterium]